MKTVCQCDFCVNARNQHAMKKKQRYDDSNNTTLQQEFESTCFMYEMVESNLKQAVDKFNGGKTLNNTQKQILAKAIWRN